MGKAGKLPKDAGKEYSKIGPNSKHEKIIVILKTLIATVKLK